MKHAIKNLIMCVPCLPTLEFLVSECKHASQHNNTAMIMIIKTDIPTEKKLQLKHNIIQFHVFVSTALLPGALVVLIVIDRNKH